MSASAWARALWDGATRPSLPALVGALAIAASLWAGAAALLGPEVVASGAMVVEHDDDFAEVGAVSTRLASRGAPAGPVLVLLGTSALREALPDPAFVARSAAPGGGSAPEVVALVAAALTPLEMVALAEALPRGLHGVAVVEISERNLAVGAEEYADVLRVPRLPLASTTQATLARTLALVEPRTPTGNYFVDHAPFFLARPKAARVLFGAAPMDHWWHQVDRLPPPSAADWARLTRRMAGWLEAPEATLAANEQVYAALVALLRERGLDVVLLGAPRNPAFLARVDADAGLAAARRANVDRVARLADALGTPLWYVGDEVRVQAVEFKDYTHLFQPQARERFARRLGERVAARVGGAR